MGFTSIWHWLVVLVIVLLVFGAGKLPKVAGDLAKGIKNFKSGLKDEDAAQADAARQLHQDAAPAAQPQGSTTTAQAQTGGQPASANATRPAETARS
ncbi:MAG: twin-arginine translocase TatA/TatE family subunit [Rhodospirillales bacterium]|jgi:sec-independent protein translocase protein TatA